MSIAFRTTEPDLARRKEAMLRRLIAWDAETNSGKLLRESLGVVRKFRCCKCGVELTETRVTPSEA